MLSVLFLKIIFNKKKFSKNTIFVYENATKKLHVDNKAQDVLRISYKRKRAPLKFFRNILFLKWVLKQQCTLIRWETKVKNTKCNHKQEVFGVCELVVTECKNTT